MDKFLIAPIKSGLKTDIVPFMTPEDSFQSLKNMFIYEGKIRRRPGTVLMDTADARGLTSRLRINIGTTNVVTGDLGITVVPGTAAIGQQFSVGATIFTVYQANGAMTVSPAGATGTFNVGTNTVTITGATPNTTVYFYPSQMVTGFATYFAEVDLVFALDLQFVYLYDTTTGGWERVIGGAGLFTTTRDDRFLWENFQGAVSGEAALFVTNDEDHIRYYTATTPTFTDFIPATSVTPNNNIRKCVDIIGFQNRLLLLNTVEYEGALVNVDHSNRIRYSEYGNAFAVDSWYSPPGITNKGGFVDLPAGEIIVTAEILDGRLIVFTQDTIYELVSTGNYREPFQLALVDDTHGSESTTVVEVNNSIMFANNFGIYIYDGRNINKISMTLDDDYDSYDYRFGMIHKDSGLEVIYILLSSSLNGRYPNTMLIYNYRNNTYSIANQIVTRMGTIYRAETGERLIKRTPMTGNHKGYTHKLFETSYKNAPSQSVIILVRFDAQNIDLTMYNHQLVAGSYIRIENSILAGFNGSYKIEATPDANTVRVLNDTVVVANYLGDGTVSRIDIVQIVTKQFNPYMKQGFGTSINKLAFNVSRTSTNGRLNVIGLPNNSPVEVTLPDFYLGSRKLETGAYALVPEEAVQPRLWHHVYLQTEAESVALLLNFTEDELLDADLPYQAITINAIMLYTEPAKFI